MTTEARGEEEAPVTRVCVTCGHLEDEHAERETEVAGTTVRRFYCESCGEWHDFVAAEPP